MLAETQARIAVIDPHVARDSVKAVSQVALGAGSDWADRLSGVEQELRALGCGKRSAVWVACSLPEMQFAILSVEKMARNKLGPVAWLKFRKEVGLPPDEVIFDYEVQETVDNGVMPMLNLTAFANPYAEVEQLEQWFSARGNLQGITMDLFADRNLIAMSAQASETTALLSFDEHVSRIMLIQAGRAMFIRTIKAGTGLLRDFAETALKRTVLPHELKTALEPAAIREATPSMDQQVLRQACSDAIGRLFTQVGRALDYYTDHLKRPRPQVLLLSGETDELQYAMPELADRLGLKVEVLDPQACGANYSSEVAELFADGGAEHYSSAIGVAMGRDGHTPNLICTHDVKERLLGIKRLRRLAAGIFVVLAAVLFGGLLWQMNTLQKQKVRLAALEDRSRRMEPLLTVEQASERLAELQRVHVEAAKLAERHRLAAILAEVQQLTPPGFRIKKLELDPAAEPGFLLDGVVLEHVGDSESYLTKYVVDLNASPLFATVTLKDDADSDKAMALKRRGILPFVIAASLTQESDEDAAARRN